ncbi:MAG: GIY-YIG nuclease family protein [Hyphomicrobiales bacterium]|nr:GIY-YIG nuclease family protein [Hyphomicrobiales bacterium]
MPVVYILTNACMPGLVKIGCTERTIEERMRELSASAAVTVPFECFLAVEVANPFEIEQAIHYAFGDRRRNPKREFFELSPDRPAAILKMFETRNGSGRDVTPAGDVVDSFEEQQALDQERARRSGFRFSTAGVQPGATLVSVFDPARTCTVLDDRWVDFEGRRTSLSDSALQIAHQTGRKWKAVQGPQFWTYNGKTLTELRDELGQVV